MLVTRPTDVPDAERDACPASRSRLTNCLLELCVACVLFGSLYAMNVGELAIANATSLEECSRARAAREKTTTALVVRSWLEPDRLDDGRDTILARIRFVHRDRIISTLVRLPGTRRRVGAEVPIVFDAAHPRDADTAERVSRKADDRRVEDDMAAGWRDLAIGATGLAAVIARCLLHSRRDRRSSRSSNWRPEVPT
jgi:hypothetical protein